MFLAMCMLCSVLCSCSSNEKIEDSQTDSERITITYWDRFSSNVLPDNYSESLIESKFPVDIQVNRADTKNMNQVYSVLQSERVPDVFWSGEHLDYIKSLELSRSIPREMVEKYAPSFLKLYDKYPSIYTTITTPDNKDEFFALNGATDQSAGVANSLYADYYRYDWIQALGIDLGVEVTQISDNFYVADTGLTLDKFEEVMHGFTYGDPDGNGIDDTQGASFSDMDYFDLLYSGFGIINGINEENGKAQNFYATEGFKNFSSWFSEMFSKGYFDKEFFHQTFLDRREKTYNEEYGYFLESSIALNSWASDRPPLKLIEKNPNATFLITPGLSNNEGNGTMIKHEAPTYGGLCYISKDVDDEKLALILQVLEYINFGEEKISMWFGEEDVDWAYDENNKVKVINNIGMGENGARFFIQNVQVDEIFEAINLEPTFEAGRDFWLYDCIWRENDREQYQYKLDLYRETDYGELDILYSDACTVIYKKYFENWVYNGVDVESTWNEMLKELDNAGYTLMMDELNKVKPLEEMISEFTE